MKTREYFAQENDSIVDGSTEVLLDRITSFANEKNNSRIMMDTICHQERRFHWLPRKSVSSFMNWLIVRMRT